MAPKNGSGSGCSIGVGGRCSERLFDSGNGQVTPSANGTRFKLQILHGSAHPPTKTKTTCVARVARVAREHRGRFDAHNDDIPGFVADAFGSQTCWQWITLAWACDSQATLVPQSWMRPEIRCANVNGK
jgi:hypothetical protein